MSEELNEESKETFTGQGAPDENILPPDAWNIFRRIPNERISAGEKCTELLKVLKGVLYILLFIFCLGGLVISKVSTLLLTTSLGFLQEGTEVTYKARWRNTVATMLVICMALPHLFVFIQYLFKGLFGSQPWPTFKFLLQILFTEIAQTFALCGLVFYLLPKLDMIRGILVLSLVCIIPSTLKVLFGRPPTEITQTPGLASLYADNLEEGNQRTILKIKHATKVTLWYISNVLALGVQIGAVVCIGFFGNFHYELDDTLANISSIVDSVGVGQKPDPYVFYRNPQSVNMDIPYRFLFPLILFVTSLIWWENPIEQADRCCRGRCTNPLYTWKVEMHFYRQKSATISSLLNCGIIIAFPYMLFDSFSFDIYIPNVQRKALSEIIMEFAPIFCQIGGGIVVYSCSLLACKLNMQVACFTVPLFLSTPLSILGISLQAYYKYIPVFGHVFVWVVPEGFPGTDTEWVWESYMHFGILAAAWISALIVGGHVWSPRQHPMDRTEKPMYNSVLLEQDLMLNRRRRDTEIQYSNLADVLYFPDPVDNSGRNDLDEDRFNGGEHSPDEEPPMVYACATMWHETKKEMTQLMKSIFRVDKDQSRRRNLMQVDIGFKDPDYFNFEIHICFDDAMTMNNKNEMVPNEFVRQLVNIMDEAASCVHHCEVRLRPPAKMLTPYGARLEWSLPGGTPMTVHIKDKEKIRHKKRWSQIMYMYYLLGFKLLGLDDDGKNKQSATDEHFGKSHKYVEGSIFEYLPRDLGLKASNTFILALDGDVDFKPDAVRLLLDGMRANPKCAAVSGRIHPIGAGPVVWYQVFEYAIGHWLQKAAEHIYGCVLCCPGCFSLFRASALMDDNVMRMYSVRAESPRELVQYDQGEDRWLCTLLIQQGYLIMYNAAADALTYAPETFHEFFNQRRRWITSTLANMIDLLRSYRVTIFKNDNLSYIYMFYILFMFAVTLLSPGSVILMIAGGFKVVIGTDMINSLFLAIIPIAFFLLVCFTTKPDTHVIAAQLLGAIYAVVMTSVIVGNILNAIMETVSSPNVVVVIIFVGLLLAAGFLHPQEFTCLVPGVLYLLLIPTGLLILTLYSLCNVHVISWGTREIKKTKTAEEIERETKEIQERRKRELLERKEKGFFNWIGCYGLLRDFKLFMWTMAGRGRQQNQEELSSFVTGCGDKLDGLQKSIDSLAAMLKNPDNQSKLTGSNQQQNELQIMLQKKKEPVPEVVHNDHDRGAVQRKKKQVTLKFDVDDDHDPDWMDDEDFRRGSRRILSGRETAFWKQLIHILLRPLDKDVKKEKETNNSLRQMRTNITFAFVMINLLWILTIFQLQVVQDVLQNSVFVRVPRVDNPKEPLSFEPLSLSLMFVFGLLLTVQFFATVFHRFYTFLHIMSRTDIAGQSNKYNQLLELADQLQSLQESNLDDEFEIPEADLEFEPPPDYSDDDDDDDELIPSRARNSRYYPPRDYDGYSGRSSSRGSAREILSRSSAYSARPRHRYVHRITYEDPRMDPRNRYYKTKYLGPVHVNPDALSRNFKHRFDHMRNQLEKRGRLPSLTPADLERRARKVSIADIYKDVQSRGLHLNRRGSNPWGQV